MCKALKVAICGLLIVALAIPALAGDAPSPKAKRSAASNIGGSVYQGSAALVDRTEGLLTGCLRNTFSLFNPCMDFVKGCSTVVFAPIEKPLDYLEGAYYKTRPMAKAGARVPEPKKPEVPK
jgi:hypothetical protein